MTITIKEILLFKAKNYFYGGQGWVGCDFCQL